MKNTITGPPSSAKLFVPKSISPQTVNLRRAQPEPSKTKVGKPWNTGVMSAKDPLTLKSVSNENGVKRLRTFGVFGFQCMRTFDYENMYAYICPRSTSSLIKWGTAIKP